MIFGIDVKVSLKSAVPGLEPDFTSVHVSCVNGTVDLWIKIGAERTGLLGSL